MRLKTKGSLLPRSDGVLSSILKGGGTSLLVRGTGLLVGMGSHVLIARASEVSEYGMYSIALGWALILVVPVKLGLDQSILRFGAAYANRSSRDALLQMLRFALEATLIAGIACAVIMIFLTKLWPGIFGVSSLPDALTISGLILVLAQIGVCSAFLRSFRDIFWSQAYEQVIRSCVLIMLVLAFITIGIRLKVSGILILTFLSALLVMLLILFHVLRRIGTLPSGGLESISRRQLLGIGLPMLSVGLMQQVMWQMPLVVVGNFEGADQAGLYSVSARLAAFVSFPLMGITAIAAPMVASAFDRDDSFELRRIAVLSARLATFASLAILAGYLALGHGILGVFGTPYTAAFPVFMILSCGVVFNSLTGVCAYYLSMSGMHRSLAKITFFTLMVALVLNAVLVSLLQLIGAALAYAISFAIFNLSISFVVWKRTGVDTTAFGFHREG